VTERVDTDPKWEREAFVAETDLPARFHEEGMMWLANRALHPFGWAVGIVWDDEKKAVTGFLLQRLLDDPEGIIVDNEHEVEARRRFFTALAARAVPEAPKSIAAQVAEDYVSEAAEQEKMRCECGSFLWNIDGESGCPNPRCDKYVPVPRT